MEAVGAVVGRFGKDLIVVEFDVGAHQVGDDIDDGGVAHGGGKGVIVARRHVDLVDRIEGLLDRGAALGSI